MFTYYLAVLKKYAVFNGRARRAEYWYFLLAQLLIGIIFYTAVSVTGAPQLPFGMVAPSLIGMVTLGAYIGFGLLTILPTWGVTWRRLHDMNKSGWWILILLIPFAGMIIFYIMLAQKGTAGPNKYGPDSTN